MKATTELTQTESNKLIAEFMLDAKSSDDFLEFANPKYHSDWNWLMPVIEKIESLDFLFFISELKIEYASKKEYPTKSRCFFIPGGKLKATYFAVITFIQWYNENKK